LQTLLRRLQPSKPDTIDSIESNTSRAMDQTLRCLQSIRFAI